MKMYLGGKPINKMKVKHYSIDTNDADLQASDMQSGKVAYARGKKIIGTGRCFEFAMYGNMTTNVANYIPVPVNVIEITSLDYPIKSLIALNGMIDIDFSVEQTIGAAVIDNTEYPITAKINGVLLTLSCEKKIALQVFLGRDNYA